MRSEPQIANAYADWYRRTKGGTIADPLIKEREEFFKQLKGEVKDEQK